MLRRRDLSCDMLSAHMATAILAFFSGGGASNPPIAVDILRMALRDFALGAVLGGAACIAAFFTRWFYLLWALGNDRVNWGAWVLNLVAVAVTIASFVAFFRDVLRAS